MEQIKAVVADLVDEQPVVHLQTVDETMLGAGEVLIEAHFSAINYKDFLASTSKRAVIRNYPMIPGIDVVGTVVSDATQTFAPGTAVIVTGNDFGVSHPGGYSTYVRVPANWPIALPQGMDEQTAITLGTAGITAAASILALEQHGLHDPQDRIVVTGASGGVGSLALGMLASAGYRNLVAISRDPSHTAFLKGLGASEVMTPEQFLPEKKKALGPQKARYVLDSVGGSLLADLLTLTEYGGCVTACGNAGGASLETTVFPFILRGITLCGIDSVQLDVHTKTHLWQQMNTRLKPNLPKCEVISLAELPETLRQFKSMHREGRIVVSLQA